MWDTQGRLDRVKVMDKRRCHKDGMWSGEYYYEWSCGCRIYIPVLKDGSLGGGHRDECCPEHSIQLSEQSQGRRVRRA